MTDHVKADHIETDLTGKVLVMLIGGRRAGVVTEGHGGRLTLTYDETWRTATNSTAVSLALPLTTSTHDDRVTRAFLWGLLPDNEHVLERWARTHQVSARNPFALLRHVGEDCAGAVQFTVPDRADALLAGEGGVTWIDDNEIAQRLRILRRDPTAWHLAGTGQFSLAGAQAPYRRRTSLNQRSQDSTNTTSTNTCAWRPLTVWD